MRSHFFVLLVTLFLFTLFLFNTVSSFAVNVASSSAVSGLAVSVSDGSPTYSRLNASRSDLLSSPGRHRPSWRDVIVTVDLDIDSAASEVDAYLAQSDYLTLWLAGTPTDGPVQI